MAKPALFAEDLNPEPVRYVIVAMAEGDDEYERIVTSEYHDGGKVGLFSRIDELAFHDRGPLIFDNHEEAKALAAASRARYKRCRYLVERYMEAKHGK